MIDLDLMYSGNGSLVFSLQSMRCEIKKVVAMMIIWRKIMRRLTNGHDHDNDDGGGRCQYGAQWGSSSDQSWAVYLSLVESRFWSSSTLALLSLIFLKDHDLETPRLSIQSHPRWCCLRCLTSLTILPVSLMSRICQGSMSPSRPPWTRWPSSSTST